MFELIKGTSTKIKSKTTLKKFLANIKNCHMELIKVRRGLVLRLFFKSDLAEKITTNIAVPSLNLKTLLVRS